ncbi:unnamed protein product, partial [Ranitomeya imitator]
GDKVRLRRSVKTRRGRHRKKMGGPGPDHDAHRTGPPLASTHHGSPTATRVQLEAVTLLRQAMPFGCVTLGDKKDYNQPTEVSDRYDLGQLIKTEEFCEVFRAKEKSSGKLYTCKRFLKRDGRKVRKAAKNEINILKMVKHHNILQLIDVFETKKRIFHLHGAGSKSAVSWLKIDALWDSAARASGREVFDWILDQGYYSEKDTSNVIRQVLEAVAYLHSLCIVHRNLKLENLLYFNRMKNSKIVISDFHLAKVETSLIKEPCGTPEYLGASFICQVVCVEFCVATCVATLCVELHVTAPEVVARQRYGRPVDCWAIGVIMYILLSGNPPFYDEMEDEDYENHDKNLFRKILHGDYEFDSPYWDDISPAAKDLVTRLMEVEQDQRATAADAISHEWISGNAASDKNIKDGVCAQIEKNFAKAKWKVFDEPGRLVSTTESLFNLYQGTLSVAQYAIRFQTLSSDLGWNNEALVGAFWRGLSSRIKDELAGRDTPTALDDLISLAIRIDLRFQDRSREVVRERRSPRRCPVIRGASVSQTAAVSSSFSPEPMQVDRLKPAEQRRNERLAQGLCFYCGSASHLLRSCSQKLGNASAWDR